MTCFEYLKMKRNGNEHFLTTNYGLRMKYKSRDEEEYFSDSLRSWMVNYQVKTNTSFEKSPFEPLTSKKLGCRKDSCSDDESESTNLSLLSCSDAEETVLPEEDPMIENPRESSLKPNGNNISWSQIAEMNRTNRDFGKLVQKQNVLSMNTYEEINIEEGLGFRFLDEDERKALLNVGKTTGIRLISATKKSASLTDITHASECRQRSGSVGSMPRNKPLTIEEFRKLHNDKKAKQRQRTGFTLPRRGSSYSNDTNSLFKESTVTLAGSEGKPETEVMTLWDWDRKIIEMDLKSNLADRARQKVQRSVIAVDRETGYGESVEEYKILIGRHREFPQHIEEDYSLYPKIIQRFRISPELGKYIKSDIKDRMGKPRYHQIRKSDIQAWDSHQSLGKYQRNLKIFNWLQHLNEKEFQDVVSTADDSQVRDEDYIHVESVDEPDEKPLYLKEFKIH